MSMFTFAFNYCYTNQTVVNKANDNESHQFYIVSLYKHFYSGGRKFFKGH